MSRYDVIRTTMAAVLALFFAAGAVHAQTRVIQGAWQGFTIPGADGRLDHCVLYNRTIEALNDSPYTMLGLTRDTAGALGMLVFYRPRALRRGKDVAVRLSFDQRPALTVNGEVVSDFHVRIAGPLDARVLNALRAAKTLAATTQGKTEKFALDDVAAVLDALTTCVKYNSR